VKRARLETSRDVTTAPREGISSVDVSRLRSKLSFVSLFVTALVACSHAGPAPAPPPDMTPTRPQATPVSPLFVGTGGFGFAVGSSFPGAAAPQGLAKVGPDTSGPWGTINFLHCSGYWYGDDTIRGFTQMHLQGTGIPDYGIIALMPVATFDASHTNADGYAVKFDKSTETATPGRYGVTLPGGIAVDLTATPHAAHHRFTFPSGTAKGHVVLDIDHHLDDGSVAAEVLHIDAASQTISGSLRNLGGLSDRFGGTMVYFTAKTKRAWTGASVWSAGAAPAPGTDAKGTGVGAVLDFDLSADASPVEIQIGLSLTSNAEATANLAAEMPGFAFDAEAAATAAAWQSATSMVTTRGGTPAQQTMMQAALYHTLLMPTVQSDVDGTYVGVDGKTAQAKGFHYCSDFSLWDTYRTLHPFYDLVAPDRATDAVASLLAMAKAGGFFPKWPIGYGDSGTMIGASAEVVVADAVVKGVTGFDAEAAYQILRAAAMSPTAPPGGRGGRDQVAAYMKLGYVPSASPGSGSSSASMTIEYGQDDAALSQLAGALGHADDAAALLARSHGWQNLYDPVSGYLWAKSADGTWATAHGDPSDATDDFTEADAAQSLWGPWYDVDGLAKVMGGRAALVANLESFFENGKADYDAVTWDDPLSAGRVRKYYWGGNEPDIHSPYLFALAGRPDLTQKWVHWIEGEVFGPGADGLPGNDDAGTMSAWLIFSMIGIYPVPGTDQYVVGAPAFPHAQLSVKGGTFTVDAHAHATGADPSPDDAYVQSVTLNGAPLAQPIVHHADLRSGGSLVFEMGSAPSTWGQ
jgi:predicted alpha-1,2-mannosidase